MAWDWLQWRPKKFGFSFTYRFTGFDNSSDICKACGRQRRFHLRRDDHRFVESDSKEK